MNDFSIRITRAFKPSLLDKASFGALCTVENDPDVYLQISTDEEYPIWQEFGGTEREALKFLNDMNKTFDPF